MSESPITTFVRGITLLAVLIALPGIAVCWNHLPKDLWKESASNSGAATIEKAQHFRKDSGESHLVSSIQSVSAFAPESIYPALPEMLPALPKIQTAFREENIPVQNPWASQNPTIQHTTIQQVSWEPPVTGTQQDFASLALRLKALGATYYKLEKWGNRGEFFCFSCFVAPSEPHTYEKHFQSIGSDVVTVMQTVISDIERWRNAR